VGDVERRLGSATSLAVLPALTDMQTQLQQLVYPGFVTETGAARLDDVDRYVRGIGRRLDKLPDDPGRDRELMAGVSHVQQEYDDLVASLPLARRTDETVLQIRWMIEELRISYFAQLLRTAYPVSEQRVLRAVAQMRQ
jgi:ATP-dependent helicase HrpA